MGACIEGTVFPLQGWSSFQGGREMGWFNSARRDRALARRLAAQRLSPSGWSERAHVEAA